MTPQGGKGAERTMPRRGQKDHTHEELKELLLHFYKDTVAAGIYPAQNNMRLRGLKGGREQLNNAWDELAKEGKIPSRKQTVARGVVKITRPRPEKPKHKKEPRLDKHPNPKLLALTKQCVKMYGREKMIRQYSVMSLRNRWMSEKFHE
jgi:hypothetical protein